MEQRLLRITWLVAYVAVVAAPSLIWLVTASPHPLWNRLATLTGLLALSGLVCSALLPSRLRSLNRTLGIESVIDVHRYLGTATASMVFVHLACVVAENPASVILLDVTSAPGKAKAAVGATIALVALVVLTLLRSRTRYTYELWRWGHLALALTVLLLAGLHVWSVHQLADHPVMGPVLGLLAAATVLVLAYRWLWSPAFDTAARFVVREVRRESPTVSTVVLTPQQGEPSWAFAPGQFAWLRLNRSSAAEDHPFTIASSAHAAATEFTVRHSGDFTRRLRRLAPGQSVWVDGPHGAFTNEHSTSSGFAMIAGGVGVTPMMSMLRTAADRGDRRPYRLLVVASTVDDLLFRAELAKLRSRLDLRVTEVLRRPLDGWHGHTGEISLHLLSLVLADADHPDDVEYFVCGPPSLVAGALAALDAASVDPHRVHTELFDLA